MAVASRTQRRGVAMMLVLISLFMGTIIAAAYLASRDNSAAIGENVASASAARWSATSALEVGVAIMETETDWRTLHTDGKLLDDYPVGDATVDLDVIDMETGEAPTAKSAHIQMTAIAIVGGVEQTASAVAQVEPWDDGTVDLDLSEFAIFARDKIKLDNHATIARWPEAPLSALGKRNALGTQAVDASAVELTGDAAAIDSTVYTGPGASNSLIANSNSPELETVELLDQIPMPDAPDPGVEFPQWDDSYPVINQSGFDYTLTVDFRAGNLNLDWGADLTIQGETTLTVNHDLIMDHNSAIRVEGDVTIIVFGNLFIDDSSIQLIGDGNLTLFARGDIELYDSYIGNGPYDSATDRNATGSASYMDPQRIVVYSIPPVDHTWTWELEDNSVMKASIYAPDLAKLLVKDNSALYGRVAVPSLHLKNDGAIFYDHGLDLGKGYTNPNSSIYDGDGRILDSFTALVSLDESALSALADSGNLLVYAGNKIYGEVPVVEVGGGGLGPTPRTIPVDYEVVSFGTDIADWEAGSQ